MLNYFLPVYVLPDGSLSNGRVEEEGVYPVLIGSGDDAVVAPQATQAQISDFLYRTQGYDDSPGGSGFRYAGGGSRTEMFNAWSGQWEPGVRTDGGERLPMGIAQARGLSWRALPGYESEGFLAGTLGQVIDIGRVVGTFVAIASGAAAAAGSTGLASSAVASSSGGVEWVADLAAIEANDLALGQALIASGSVPASVVAEVAAAQAPTIFQRALELVDNIITPPAQPARVEWVPDLAAIEANDLALGQAMIEAGVVPADIVAETVAAGAAAAGSGAGAAAGAGAATTATAAAGSGAGLASAVLGGAATVGKAVLGKVLDAVLSPDPAPYVAPVRQVAPAEQSSGVLGWVVGGLVGLIVIAGS